MSTFFGTLRFARRPRRRRCRPLAGPSRGPRTTLPIASTTSRAPLQSQSGFMLLEVVISALLVALIAIGTFAGLEGAGRASADERTHAEATKLAQQDEERLRGLTIHRARRTVGKGSEEQTPITLGGLTFTVTSSVSFVSAAKNSLSCETNASGANYIQTTSSVRWTGLKSTSPGA